MVHDVEIQAAKFGPILYVPKGAGRCPVILTGVKAARRTKSRTSSALLSPPSAGRIEPGAQGRRLRLPNGEAHGILGRREGSRSDLGLHPLGGIRREFDLQRPVLSRRVTLTRATVVCTTHRPSAHLAQGHSFSQAGCFNPTSASPEAAPAAVRGPYQLVKTPALRANALRPGTQVDFLSDQLNLDPAVG